MQNFIKTIINGVQSWTKKEIKKINRTHWEDEDGTIHKLDSKYLPDNLATTDDVKSAKQEVLDVTETNKMNKINPVGTGSFSMNRKSGSNIGSRSHAEGSNTVASHFASHAEGEGTTASGQRAHAEGYNTKATNYNTHAEGYNTQATGINAHAEGEGTIASGQQAHAEGSGGETRIKLTGDANSVTYTVDSGMSYIKIGRMLKYNETIVKIVNCDSSTKTVTTQNTLSASALNSQSVQLYLGIASGRSSHSEGFYTTASGSDSHSEGYYTTASGDNSHSEGSYTTASGFDSHSEGSYTTASGNQSHAEGYHTTASGDNSHSEGSYTTASGDNSHAEGMQTVANNALMHVFGKYNIFDNQKYTMEGGFEDSLFVDSTKYFADEYTFDNETGLFSLINPSQDYTNDDVEKLIGKYTLSNSATPDAAESVLWKVVKSTEYDGEYIGRLFYSSSLAQIEGKYAHIVGNGTSDTARSNAHTLDWNGVGWYQGGLQVGGNAQDDGAKNVLLEGDAIPIPENATVGQTIAVKSVDENGKPVEWEAADFSSSGGSGCIVSDIAPEDTSVLWIDTADNSDDTLQDAVNIALAQAKESGEFKGDPGKTPEKGVDYYTDTDKAELVSAVLSALPAWTGGSY